MSVNLYVGISSLSVRSSKSTNGSSLISTSSDVKAVDCVNAFAPADNTGNWFSVFVTVGSSSAGFVTDDVPFVGVVSIAFGGKSGRGFNSRAGSGGTKIAEVDGSEEKLRGAVVTVE